jgi:hypothetical protein
MMFIMTLTSSELTQELVTPEDATPLAVSKQILTAHSESPDFSRLHCIVFLQKPVEA